MFRLSSTFWMLAAFAASVASAGDVITCHMIDKTSAVKAFSTETIDQGKYEAAAEDGDLLGPCSEYLGQLCDDGKFCTLDYDIETMKCLDFPREVVEGCIEDS